MNVISIPAHFDGAHILLDKPYPLMPNSKLLVTILPEEDEEREDWLNLSAQQLANAYDEEEPEYPVSAIREMNPNYERR